ncbi:MAG TPA: ABC transporter permease [Thermoanaerobaculia bacterium]|nr:ABC transporter permease [Thermoanaerobaculia bacterium]
MSGLLQDVRLGLRMLRRNPGLSLAAGLSLALGIGANAAIFSVVNGLLLEPLPLEEPDRLTILWESDATQAGRRMGMTSEATFRDWQREVHSFKSLAALFAVSLSLTGQDLPETLFTHRVTAGYFPVLGVRPALGRLFSEEEETRGDRVALLSHGLWQRRFGGDAGIVGRTVGLDGEPHQVIGVMPADFRSPVEAVPVQLWVPLAPSPIPDRKQRQLLVYGRLADGISLQTAREEVASLNAELVRRYPEEMQGRGASVEQLKEVFVGGIRPALLVLLGAGGFLLLIVCSNVAHLLLVRALSRQREMAVRTALGAAPRQILRQLLTESVILALAGAAAGLFLARLGLALIKTLVPMRFDLPRLDALDIDGRVLLFTLVVALVTAVAFGLVPARMAFSRTGEGASAGSARATAGRQRGLLRAALVVTEVALVLVLLIGTGLMAKTFLSLSEEQAGRDPERVLLLRTALRGPRYEEGPVRARFFRQTLESIRQVPGVAMAGATDLVLLGNPRGGERFLVEGDPVPAPGSEPIVQVQLVTPEYFEALEIPLVQGRAFRDDDGPESTPVAMVNRLFAETWLKGREHLGRGLVMTDGGGEVRRIVGVVREARVYVNPPEPVPTIYIPAAQKPPKIMTFVVRTRGEPETLSARVQETILRQDPMMSTFAVTTLEKSQADADWQSRFSLVLLAVFASLALVLAVTGIYAVISSGVAERTREFGIRMAFGAKPGDLLSLVLRSGLRQAGLGLVFGLTASLVFVRILESQLYGVAATDPAIYATLSALLAAVVLVACSVPAWRASRVDPVITLRQE